MKEPAIVFKDFSFQYRVQHEPTLHDINLTIYKGEKVLILGSSGSGKSTLANCINGLIPFSHHGTITGSVTVMGQETRDLMQIRSRFVMNQVVYTFHYGFSIMRKFIHCL